MTFNIPLKIKKRVGWCGDQLASDTTSENTLQGIQILWLQYIMTSVTKRASKAALLPLRRISYKRRWMRLYYWSENKLDKLRAVYVMPLWYYRRLYRACMWLVAVRPMQRIADRAIHTIPYHVRFEVA